MALVPLKNAQTVWPMGLTPNGISLYFFFNTVNAQCYVSFQVYNIVIPQLYLMLCQLKVELLWSPHNTVLIPLTVFPMLCLSSP